MQEKIDYFSGLEKINNNIQLKNNKKSYLNKVYATGKRKNAVARVWIKSGTGKITVNNKDFKKYFSRQVLQMILSQPIIFSKSNNIDIISKIHGGGLSGQAGALRHAISKSLIIYNPALRSTMKKAGFLTRDSRIVERKKYGKAKSRRSFQFSKR